MFSWSTLLTILYQRKRIRDSIPEEVAILYDSLLGRDYGSYSQPQFSYDVEEDTYNVTIRVWHNPLPIEEMFLFPDLNYTEDEEMGYRGNMEYRYNISFRASPDLMDNLNLLHQLHFRPYSPVYFANFNDFQEISYPINRVPLPTRSAPASLAFLPEELKYHILTYSEPEESPILEEVLDPDIDYLVQEALNLDPNFSLENLVDTLKKRVELSSEADMSLLRKLTQVEEVSFQPSFLLLGDEYRVVNDRPVDVQELFSPFTVTSERLTRRDGDYIYDGTIRDRSTALEELDISAELTSLGYSLPISDEVRRLFTIDYEDRTEEWITVWKNV